MQYNSNCSIVYLPFIIDTSHRAILDQCPCKCFLVLYPDSKVHGANMGSTWGLSAPDGSHVGPMNLAIRVGNQQAQCWLYNVDMNCQRFLGLRDFDYPWSKTTRISWHIDSLRSGVDPGFEIRGGANGKFQEKQGWGVGVEGGGGVNSNTITMIIIMYIYISNTIDIFKLFYYNIVYLKPPYTIL